MKKLASTLSTFLIYLYIPLLISVFFKFVLHIQLSNTNLEHVYWLNIGVDIIYLISAAILNYKALTQAEFDGKSFWNKVLTFIARLIIVFLIFMVIKVLFAVIVSVIAYIFHLSAESNNQMLVEQVVRLHPVGMFASVCIFAPIMEELIFRGSIRKIINNNWLFVLTSGFLFGLIHVMNQRLPIIILLLTAFFIDLVLRTDWNKGMKFLVNVGICLVMLFLMLFGLQISSGNIIELFKNISMSEAVNSITYITMGLCLAYVYKKYNNIYICMGIHALNNLLGFVIIIFTMI